MENESLRQLCEQAGREQDSTRLLELVQEIIEAIDTTRRSKPVEWPKKARTRRRRYLSITDPRGRLTLVTQLTDAASSSRNLLVIGGSDVKIFSRDHSKGNRRRPGGRLYPRSDD